MTDLRINTGQLSEIHQMNKVFSEQLQDLAKSHKAHEATLVLEFQNRVTEIEQGWQNEKTLLEQAVAEMQAKYEHVLSISEEQTVREDRLRGDYAAQLEALRGDQAEREVAFKHAHQEREAELQQDFERKLFGLQSAWLGERTQLERTIESLGATEERLRADYTAQLEALRGDQVEREVAFKHAHQEREAELQQDFERKLFGLQSAWLGERTQLERTIESLGATEERLRADYTAQLEALRGDQVEREVAFKHAHQEREAELKQDFERQLLRLQTAWVGERTQLQRMIESLGAAEERLRADYSAQLEVLRRDQAERVIELKEAHEVREVDLRKGFELHLAGLQNAWMGEKEQLEKLVDALRKHGAFIEANRLRLETDGALSQEQLRLVMAEINTLRQSWSWRLTWPLRWLAGKHIFDLFKLSLIERSNDSRTVQEIDISSSAPPLITDLNEVAQDTAMACQFTATQVADQWKRETIMTLDELLSLQGDAFIKSAYRILVGRDADEVGLRHYLTRLRCGYDKPSIIFDIAQSSEAQAYANNEDLAHLSDDEFLVAIYRRLLGRAPDPAGKHHYLSLIKKSNGRKRVISDLKRSVEAVARNVHICSFANELSNLLSQQKRLRGWRGWLSRGQRLERRISIIEDHLLVILEKLSSIEANRVNGDVMSTNFTIPVQANNIPNIPGLSARANSIFIKLKKKV